MDDNAQIHATMKDGVLHVELAKSTKARSISIDPQRTGH